MQVTAEARAAESLDDFKATHERTRRGDIVGVRGKPGRTRKGQLSLFPSLTQILTPCLHMLPRTEGSGLKDQETRYRMRFLDLIMNNNVRDTFIMRSNIIRYVRKYLDDRDFVEVETPMMNMIAGGAHGEAIYYAPQRFEHDIVHAHRAGIVFEGISRRWYGARV